MAARPVPRIAEQSVLRASLGSVLEWVRVLAGRGDRLPSTSMHLWLVLAWILLIVGTAASARTLRAREALPADLLATSVPAAAAPDSVRVEEPRTVLDLAPLQRGTLFRRAVVRERPKPSTIVPDLANELQLQGVIGGESPQAIIYHKRTQQTHSVRIGQRFGEFEVLEIQPMRVLLKWRDETIELSI